MSFKKIKLIAVVGPTASGKSALAVKIAKGISGEIISADSMQIYKGMDIATAKPTIDEQCNVRHHLIDYVDPSESYSVARFVDDAKFAINDIISRGKIPILAGGTGLYIDSLVNGIAFSEGDTDFDFRNKLQNLLKEKGIEHILNLLKEIDSVSYDKMTVERNPKRIIRALEVYHTTGITFSRQNELSTKKPSDYSATYIGLSSHDRQKLYDRINLRVDLMLKAGLIDEAKNYFKTELSNTSVGAIGYKELKPYLDGEKTLEDCVETLKMSTRRYAKRQLTWFRRNENIKWFYFDEYNDREELYVHTFKYLKQKGFETNEE